MAITVIPAEAGIQGFRPNALDPRLRGDDEWVGRDDGWVDGVTDVPDRLMKKRKMRMAQPAGKQNEEQRKK